ncbi:MAG: hypothetical protein JWR26_1958 [Pedosphaera sp.]|nr:hypothetical protein [Pedosphaera sp.]
MPGRANAFREGRSANSLTPSCHSLLEKTLQEQADMEKYCNWNIDLIRVYWIDFPNREAEVCGEGTK